MEPGSFKRLMKDAERSGARRYVLIGEREAAAGTVAPRGGNAQQPAVPVDAFVAETSAAARIPGGVP